MTLVQMDNINIYELRNMHAIAATRTEYLKSTTGNKSNFQLLKVCWWHQMPLHHSLLLQSLFLSISILSIYHFMVETKR